MLGVGCCPDLHEIRVLVNVEIIEGNACNYRVAAIYMVEMKREAESLNEGKISK